MASAIAARTLHEDPLRGYSLPLARRPSRDGGMAGPDLEDCVRAFLRTVDVHGGPGEPALARNRRLARFFRTAAADSERSPEELGPVLWHLLQEVAAISATAVEAHLRRVLHRRSGLTPSRIGASPPTTVAPAAAEMETS